MITELEKELLFFVCLLCCEEIRESLVMLSYICTYIHIFILKNIHIHTVCIYNICIYIDLYLSIHIHIEREGRMNERKENVLFNNILNTFNLYRIFCVRDWVTMNHIS